jgi:hypothetical protein
MGLEVLVPWGSPEAGVAGAAPCPLVPLLEKLTADGVPCGVAMLDGALHMPAAPLPEDWREVRLQTGAGAVTLTRKPGAIAVVVFANADDALKAVQAKVATALGGPASS